MFGKTASSRSRAGASSSSRTSGGSSRTLGSTRTSARNVTTGSGRSTSGSSRLSSTGSSRAGSGRLTSTGSSRAMSSRLSGTGGSRSSGLTRKSTRGSNTTKTRSTRTGERTATTRPSGHSSRSLASRGSFKRDATARHKAAAEAKATETVKIKFDVSELQLKATLGTGTFGRVRLAKHPNGKHYALKILKKSEIIRLKQVDHIKSEVRILGMIQHPFIVNMVGHAQSPTHLYMLLEYVPGGELFSHLRREVRFSNDGAKFYGSQIVSAFQHLHSFNIVYRDLKPENLLITRTGYLKITDFGFAKVVDDRTWTLCGTPEYLAPELIQSKGHNKSVDWWAVGILIYEMLAGFPPFYDDTPFGIYQKILAGRIDFPKHFDVKAKDLVRKLLTADVTQRLGCLRNGAEDIKSHRWFGRLNWDDVFNCSLKAPFVPDVRGADDTRNFDEYPESANGPLVPLTTKQKELFDEFDRL